MNDFNDTQSNFSTKATLGTEENLAVMRRQGFNVTPVFFSGVLQAIDHKFLWFIYYLLTESEVITGKSQTEALMNCPSDSEVNTLTPRSEISL